MALWGAVDVPSQGESLLDMHYCRQKCQETIGALAGEQAYRLCRYPWGEVSFVELQLYNLRHVQEPGAQLRMFLGQRATTSAKWISA